MGFCNNTPSPMPKTDIGRFFAIFLLKGVEKGLKKNKNPLKNQWVLR